MSEIQQTPSSRPQPLAHTIDISAHISRSLTVSTNLDQDVIITTKDKIANALHEVLPKFRRRVSWVAPVGVTASLWIALASTDFNQKLLGIPADTWKGAFLLAAVLGSIWVLVAVGRAVFGGASHAHVLSSITATHSNATVQTIQGHVDT
ncbi:hypothetical protein J2X01_000727 [Arthrobacter ginsengisoli]|uniref:Uncharacterized protein n=1 Tax=Arthrobacter ginsengisoli TaxID=1356565 RepID=A0ABU1U8G8_9MICC|nr:hypothetical protein [Arthrobacter ginsengisoli]MDR7081450.1 hypothetical protein [Arthrobacter ginsengisoli]